MHELGIIVHISRTLDEVAKENNLTEIGSVPDYMTDCWKYYRKKSELFKDSDLKIEILPAVTYCEACQKTYPTVEFGRQCPGCGSFETYLLTGNECSIKEIEAC